MSPNPNRDRRILLVLIILLLVSISYLSLQAASYFGGGWQFVSGQGNQPLGGQGREVFSLQVPERTDYMHENFSAIRGGKLFFKPRKVELVVTPPEPPDQINPIKPVDPQETDLIHTPPDQSEEKVDLPPPPKPTCPYVVSGILWGDVSSAILVNKATQKSQTVRVGTVLGDFTVMAIDRDSVLVQSAEAEFKLKLGGM
jgi:hypothetical protein